MKNPQAFKSIPLTMKGKLILIVFIAQCYYPFAQAQESNHYFSQSLLNNTKPISHQQKDKKRFWRATAEWTMVQALPWAANRFVRKAEFARVDLKSIDSNLKIRNWEWDDNKFFNNQFSHPFQGSLYFNAFRSNGYNFWESVPSVFIGTYTWETFLEKHVPAPNDLITTSLGGIVIGEMSHRLSDVILRKTSRSKKFLCDPVALIINPMNGANRIMEKKWGQPKKSVSEENTITKLAADAGIRKINSIENRNAKKIGQEFYTRINLQYGNPYSNCRIPFNNFSLNAEFGSSDSSIANTLQIEGCLYGKIIRQSENATHVLNLSMNYNYFKNTCFVFGDQSFNVNFLSRYAIRENVYLQLKAGAGIIPLAAIQNTHMYYGEGRNYDYGSGISVHAGAEINIANRAFVTFNSKVAKTITVNGYESTHLLRNTDLDFRLVIYKGLSITAATSNYAFNGYYDKYPNTLEHYSFQHFGIGYTFKM